MFVSEVHIVFRANMPSGGTSVKITREPCEWVTRRDGIVYAHGPYTRVYVPTASSLRRLLRLYDRKEGEVIETERAVEVKEREVEERKVKERKVKEVICYEEIGRALAGERSL